MSKLARKFKIIPKIHKQRETDSLTSLFSWNQNRNPPIYPNAQTGRTVDAAEFYLFYICVMFLILGIGLSSMSLWTIFHKIYYNYLINTFLSLAHFTIPAALLCFPCFWITLAVHNEKKAQKYLPLVMILLICSISLLSVGVYFGVNHPLLQSKNVTSRFTKQFNESMHVALNFCGSNDNYRKIWDEVQRKLNCCGVENSRDWLKIAEKPPPSCNGNDTGCLVKVIKDLTWQTAAFTGLMCSGLLIQCCTFVGVVAIYFARRHERSQ